MKNQKLLNISILVSALCSFSLFNLTYADDSLSSKDIKSKASEVTTNNEDTTSEDSASKDIKVNDNTDVATKDETEEVEVSEDTKASQAKAEPKAKKEPSNFYIGTKIGASIIKLSQDCGYGKYTCDINKKSVLTLNPFVGYKFIRKNGLGTRVEIEAFYHSKANFDYDGYFSYEDIKEYTRNKTSLNSYGAFANAYVDFFVSDLFTPYIGLGIGYAHHETDVKVLENRSFTQINDKFAYHFDLGTSVNFAENFALDFIIRYNDFGDILPDYYFQDISNTSIDILTGIRYYF